MKLYLPSAKAERHRLLQFVLAALVPVGALAILAAREGHFAHAGGFEVSLTSLVVLALCLVALICIGRIHRRLAPLETLREETRRIIARDRDARVGDDELR